MNYTAGALENIEFKKSFSGYNENEVDELLDNIIADYNSFARENNELKDKLNVLTEGINHYKSIEESLQSTIVIAQQTADEVKKSAIEKADLILKEAELKAAEITNQAERDLNNALKEYNQIISKISEVKIKLKSILKSEIDILDQLDFDKVDEPSE